jgi:hypothetical protein
MIPILPLQWFASQSLFEYLLTGTQMFVQNVVHINQAFVAVIMDIVSLY